MPHGNKTSTTAAAKRRAKRSERSSDAVALERARSLPLEDVYVELETVTELPEAADSFSAGERRLLLEAELRGMEEGELRMHLDSLRLQRWRQTHRSEHKALTRRSIEEAIAEPSRPGLVILGDPGSGKTTLLRYLALVTAKAGLGQSAKGSQRLSAGLYSAAGQARIPIFVPLAAYDEATRSKATSPSLGDFLSLHSERWLGEPGLAALFRKALDEGRALLLLDGLDEALDLNARRHIAQQVKALFDAEAGRGNRFVITSRVVGYREAPLPGNLPHVVVLDFDPKAIERFAHRFCEAYEAEREGDRSEQAIQRAAREAKALIAELCSRPKLLALAANPLLLTMLALLRRAHGRLPVQRVELYRRHVEALLDNHWETARSEGARDEAPERLDSRKAVEILTELALWLHQRWPSGAARREDLAAALVDIALRRDGVDPAQATGEDRKRAEQSAARFLREMRYLAGLIAERGQGAFGFLHLTFQEYFVGRALARMPREEHWTLVAAHMHDPRWHEPIVLSAGWLGVVEQRRDEVNDLARRILHAQSPHEEILHRDTFLTSEVAADDIGLDEALLDELAARFIALVDSPVDTLRLAAQRGLIELWHLEHEAARRWLLSRFERKERLKGVEGALREIVSREAGRPLRQVLCGWLDDADAELQRSAIWLLAPLVPVEPEVRALVLARASSRSMSVCHEAMHALAPLAASDETIRRFFIEGAEGKFDKSHVPTAIRALAPLASSDEEIKRLIRAKASSTERFVRSAALHALASLIPSDEDIKQLVLERTRTLSGFELDDALRALTPLLDADEDIRGLLLSRIGDASEWNVERMLTALAPRIASDASTRSFVIELAEHGKEHVRYAALDALGPLIVSDNSIRELIIAHVNDQSASIRQIAVDALSRLGPEEPELRRLALSRLDEEAIGMRHEMIRALAPLVPRDEAIRRLIEPHLDDAIPVVRQAAIEALAPLAASDEQIRALIAAKLDDPEAPVREAAIVALPPLATSDEDLRRRLLERTEDVDDRVCGAAMTALAPLVQTDEVIRRHFFDKVESSKGWVHSAAMRSFEPLVASDEGVRRFFLEKASDMSSNARGSALLLLKPLATSDPAIRRLLLEAAEGAGELSSECALEAIISLGVSDEAVRRLVFTKAKDPAETTRMSLLCALPPEAVADETIKRLVIEMAADPNRFVRAMALRALAPLAASDEGVKRLLLEKTVKDREDRVRRAAIRVLAPLVPIDEETRRAILARTGDSSFEVRSAAVLALIPLLANDGALAQTLLPWLGADFEVRRGEPDASRRALADAYGPLLANDANHAALRARVIEMLRARPWQARKGAAWALIAMPFGPPPEVMPILMALLDDQRGEESWSERLQMAEILLNARDPALSERAVQVALQTLDYGTEPWYGGSDHPKRLRTQAAVVLGRLDPLYRSDAIFHRLARVLAEDGDNRARDAAFQTLLRLAAAPGDELASGERAQPR